MDVGREIRRIVGRQDGNGHGCLNLVHSVLFCAAQTTHHPGVNFTLCKALATVGLVQKTIRAQYPMT